MRSWLVPLVAGFLSGCSGLVSLAPVVDNNALDYHQTVESVTNNILVTNILRARDHAPTHYASLSVVTGSVQGTASAQLTVPFGPHVHLAPDSLQLGGVSLQITPNFTLGTLDTDDFTKGILTPVGPDVIKYFLDHGLDSRIAFLLFFEAVIAYDVPITIDGKAVDTTNKIHNSPDNDAEFKTFLAIANYDAVGLYANSYQELRPIGAPFSIDLSSNFDKVAAIDITKARLRPAPPASPPPSASKTPPADNYVLYAVSPDTKFAFCRYSIPTGNPKDDASEITREHLTADRFRIFGLSNTILPSSAIQPSAVCLANEVTIDPASQKNPIVLIPRSPQGILEYLGALLRFQDRHKGERGPITLGDDEAGGALFKLTRSESAGLDERERFSVKYQGDTYYVDESSDKDHTLEVLALLNQLFNLYKSAKDIPSIRPVTVLP